LSSLGRGGGVKAGTISSDVDTQVTTRLCVCFLHPVYLMLYLRPLELAVTDVTGGPVVPHRGLTFHAVSARGTRLLQAKDLSTKSQVPKRIVTRVTSRDACRIP